MKTLVALMVAIILVSSAKSEVRELLSKSEVQRLFIGKPWRGPSGTFLFKRNGTYTYRRGSKTGGPWNYQLKSDGTIRGATTSYRFYRAKMATMNIITANPGDTIPLFWNEFC